MTAPHFNDQIDWNPDGVPFCNGKVAMAENFLWSTYCLGGAGDDWDIAAIPAYNGKQTAAFNADTFRILKDTKHPDAAFTVLTYLLGDGGRRAAHDLRRHAGHGPPTRRRSASRRSRTQLGHAPEAVDWQVAVDGIELRRTSRTSSRRMPVYNETPQPRRVRRQVPRPGWDTTQGLDMDSEIQPLQHEIAGDLGQVVASSSTADQPTPADADGGVIGDRLTALAARPGRSASDAVASCQPLARREARWGLLFISPVAHRLPAVHAAARWSPRSSSRSPTSTFASRTPFAVRRPQELPGHARATRRSGRRCASPSRFAALWLPITLIVPFLVALVLNSPQPARLERLPGPVLPALRGPVRGGRPRSGRACSSLETGWLNQCLRSLGIAEPARLAQRPDLDLSGPRADRHLGHRRRRDHQPGRPARLPDRAVRRGQDRRRRLVGASCAT